MPATAFAWLQLASLSPALAQVAPATEPTPGSIASPTPATTAPTEVRLPVAPPDATPAAAAARPADTLSASDAYGEFRTAFDAGRYEPAVPYAQRVLALAESAARTPVDEEVQVALMNLAMTQYFAGDYVGAEESYTRAIKLVETSGRPLQARLARAYAGLAATYHAGNRHDLAVENFQVAVGLTRRHEGLLTDAQVPLLEKYIDSLTRLGRYVDAVQGWKYVMRIATRKYGETGPELAPTMERIGRWYTQVGLYDQARRTLKRGIAYVEAAEGESSPRLIDLLVAVAYCDRRQLMDPNQQLAAGPDADRPTLYHDPALALPGPVVSVAMLQGEAERSLLRAATIADERPDPVPSQIADVRTQLGDWYQTRSAPDRALVQYQKAWAAAEQVKQQVDGKPVTAALFGQPVLLLIYRPESWDRYAARPPDQVETRNVVIEFTVDAQGYAKQPKVVDDSGDPKRVEKSLAALETARYRPRFERGLPVETAGVTFSQPWILLLPATDATVATPAADAAPKPAAPTPPGTAPAAPTPP